MKHVFFNLFFLVFCLFTNNLSAQTIATTQPLDFGTSVITNNDAPRQITVQTNGAYFSDPEFSIVIPPVPGNYLLTDAGAPFTLITTVNITVDQQMIGAGQDFVIDNFDISHPGSTNGAGELPIIIGARLTTTGSGIAYTPNETFTSSMTLDVIY